MTAALAPGSSLRSPARRGRPSVRTLGPNWYATVMGTAVIAIAGSALRLQVPWLQPVFLAVWTLSAVLLGVLLVARTVHWLRHGDEARAQLCDPESAPFYGCLSMAVLAVGGGALSLGLPGGVHIDAVMWLAGTVLALVTAAAVPYLMTVQRPGSPAQASPVWLLPVVAPMVSAALGPPLAAHLPYGQARLAMQFGSYALFGMSLFATLLLLPSVFARLLRHGPLPVALTPALFLVLGPLGQSTTALGNLADGSPARFATAAVLYGVPVTGFALLWLSLAAALVLRAVRHGMRFSMTWWSFTFPLGTCVTGAASLARHTHLHALHWLAAGLYALLVAGWLAACTGTVRALLNGELLSGELPAAPRTATGEQR